MTRALLQAVSIQKGHGGVTALNRGSPRTSLLADSQLASASWTTPLCG
jgi:hypothetical protein